MNRPQTLIRALPVPETCKHTDKKYRQNISEVRSEFATTHDYRLYFVVIACEKCHRKRYTDLVREYL